jgi:hypothetical protein
MIVSVDKPIATATPTDARNALPTKSTAVVGSLSVAVARVVDTAHVALLPQQTSGQSVKQLCGHDWAHDGATDASKRSQLVSAVA